MHIPDGRRVTALTTRG